jgi:hypothetical protein
VCPRVVAGMRHSSGSDFDDPVSEMLFAEMQMKSRKY